MTNQWLVIILQVHKQAEYNEAMMILNTYYTQQVFIRTNIRVSEKYVINGYNSIHYKPLDPT